MWWHSSVLSEPAVEQPFLESGDTPPPIEGADPIDLADPKPSPGTPESTQRTTTIRREIDDRATKIRLRIDDVGNPLTAQHLLDRLLDKIVRFFLDRSDHCGKCPKSWVHRPQALAGRLRRLAGVVALAGRAGGGRGVFRGPLAREIPLAPAGASPI